MTTVIDDVCHQNHLYQLSTEIVEWEIIATYLGFSEADTAAIKHNHANDYKLQKYQMLCEWKKRNGENATYRTLADIFSNNGHCILADKLLKTIMLNEPVPSVSTVLEKFKGHLKLRYKHGIRKHKQWPPLPASEIYINLALIKEQNVKLNKIDDPYTRSTIHYCPDDVLKQKVPINLKDIFKFEKSEKKCILIEGGPGLGKTTLSFKICKDWANGNLLQDYDAVIMLQLRFKKLQKAEEIADLLFEVEYDEGKQEVLKEICDNGGDRVCFIVEGFDELPHNLQIDSIFTDISQKLPRALVIYTSRPVAVLQAIEQMITKRIEIIGFKSEQVQEYVETTLDHLNKEHSQNEDIGQNKAEELIRIIKSNIFVERLTHIPIYLAIVTHIFNSKNYLPSTRTELFQWLVNNIILHYLIEKKANGETYLKSLDDIPEVEKRHFANICHLAFQGLQNSEITFNTIRLHEYDIPEDINGLGLLYIAPTLSDYGIIQSLNFMHLNFQEFCAAYYISKLSEDQQQAIFMKHQDNPKFQVCWQFLSGLTELKCRQIFTSMIPKSTIHSSFCKLKLIQLLLCLYEAKSPDLCKEVIKFMNGSIDLSRCDMDLLSCSSLGYLIKNCTGSIKTLKLALCGIGNKDLQYICESLISNYKSSSGVNMHHLCLDISYNELTEHGAQHIAKLLSSPCIIKSLNCTGNYKLGDNGVEIIANSLLNSHVNNLELRRTGLGLKGIQAISEVLRSDSSLKNLDISENILDFEMLSCLLESLAHNCTLTTLLLKWCRFGPYEAKLLSNMIKSNNTLVTLDLGYNKLGAGGIASIVEALKENKTLQTLNLNFNGMICDDACFIADLISTNLDHMSTLHIGGNFDEQGLATVCEAIKHNFSLTTIDLTPDIMSVAKEPLGFLGNVFSNINIKSLQVVIPHDCSCLSLAIATNATLEELKICAEVTNGFETLTQSIARNKTIKKLEFLFTRVQEQWLKDISNMLLVKTNLVSLVINGEFNAEDCVLLCDALLNCSLLQKLSFTPFGKMMPSKALEFLSRIQALNSLESITLSTHQIQHSAIPDQQVDGTAQPDSIPKQNVLIFNQIECLISVINERRCSIGYPELWLFIHEN